MISLLSLIERLNALVGLRTLGCAATGDGSRLTQLLLQEAETTQSTGQTKRSVRNQTISAQKAHMGALRVLKASTRQRRSTQCRARLFRGGAADKGASQRDIARLTTHWRRGSRDGGEL